MLEKVSLTGAKMEDCLFCNIIKGSIPSEKVYEDENVLAFKDIQPAAPIHILIIPKQHVQNIMEMKEPEMMVTLMEAVQKIAKQIGVDKTGFRLITNCGKDAGQEVMHLHFHLLAGKPLGEKIVG